MRCVETATRAFFSLPKTLAFVISWLVPLAEFFFMAFDLSLTLSWACKRLSSAWSATVCPPVSTLASLVEILSLPRPSLRLCYFRSCLVSLDMYASSSASASPSPSCGPPSSSYYFPLKRLFKLLFLAAIWVVSWSSLESESSSPALYVPVFVVYLVDRIYSVIFGSRLNSSSSNITLNLSSVINFSTSVLVFLAFLLCDYEVF